MKYLLAAIDIDGTLSNSNKELSGYTVSTIIKAQKRGLKIVIASGRPTRGLAYYADLLQIYDYGGYIMAYNGGQITDFSTGKCIYNQALTADAIKGVDKKYKEAGFDDYLAKPINRNKMLEVLNKYLS